MSYIASCILAMMYHRFIYYKRIQKYKPRRSFFSSPKLEGILETIKVELSQIPTTNSIPHNLSLSERKALRELKCNPDLVINKADKGSTIVVQDKNDYIRNALEHLNDPHTYRVLDGNPTSNICTGINFLLSDFYKKGLLDKDMVAFCSPPKKVRPARLYFLKKIHKTPMGIRPIVSSCESPTENISQFLDYCLQPIMRNLLSYLKDTSQLINELRMLSVEPNTILVTIDVKSLYTCIPHLEGIQACTEALQKAKENNPSQPDTAVLGCLLEIVLKNNCFEFYGTYYKQLQGTAMGTKLAPAYANIFMGYLEHNILSQAPLKPSFYKRYIDDIFILWPHSETDLTKFLSAMNNFHPSIKFTCESNMNRITFLDLNIYKGPNFLSTKKLDVETHIKPTNRQAHSHHPPGASKGVAIGELKRYLRINSQNSTFNKFKAHHMRNLRKRGYSNGFINNYTNKVKFFDRSVKFFDRLFELKPKIKRPFKKTVFVTRFTPSAKPAMHVIKKYWPSIQHLKIFNNNPLPTPMLSYKSNKNLKSFLVRAKLPSLDCTTETTPTSNLTLEYTPIPSSTTDNEDRQS